MRLTTQAGFARRGAQDVVTRPDKKWMRIQCEGGFVEVSINGWDKGDLLRFGREGQNEEEIRIEKTRPDDFYEEILHIQGILDGQIKVADSPISFQRGVATMKVIQAAHLSNEQRRAVVVE